MGCGASTGYQYEVNLTWEQVSRTVDKLRSKEDKLVLRHSSWKTVRIFVSSTFRDFHSERDVLIKEVFADLRHWCEKRRLHLVECDLRWGVPKDTTDEIKLRTCLEEIDRCYEDNVMPFFLNMTSERCGWIPGMKDVPQHFAAEYRWIHGLSVTEMEIMHGAYRKGNPNSLFMIRDSSFLDSVPEKHHEDFIDIKDRPQGPLKLKRLKKMLQGRFEHSQVFLYQCEVAGVNSEGIVQLKGLDNFSQKVFEFFTQRIGEQYPLVEIQTDPYQQQQEAHEAYMKNKGDVVLGRDSILQEIQQYITELAVDYPMVLVGEAGSGKSAIMARVADVATTKALNKEIPGGGDTGWHVFYHFVGAIPGSTDLETMLKRLLRELGIVNDATMPKDLDSTVQLACGVLSSRTTRPTIIIVDAVNQMDDDPHAHNVSWLPRKLAPQVRAVLSMIDGTPQHRALTERQRKPQEVKVTALSKEDRQEIVTAMLDKYNKRLDQEQMNSLLSKDSSDNPLWLAVACEELRVYGVFEKVSEKIDRLADGLLNLLAQVLERFEEEYGGKLLVATLCLLETSAKGMLEVELLRMLGDEDNLLPPEDKREIDVEVQVQPPAGQVAPVKWAGVYRALKPFLRPFGDSGEGRLDFYHRSLSKAVRRKYFGADEDEDEDSADSRYRYRWWHYKQANFFHVSENIDRRVEEYPHHLVQLGAQGRLADCLTEWSMFDKLYHPEWSAQLLLYWRKAGGYDTMDSRYSEALDRMEQDPEVSLQDKVLRHEKVARVLLQAGKLKEAWRVVHHAIEREESELGARPERMAELYYVAGLIYDEIVKSVEFVSRETMDDLRPCIEFLRKSIALREQLEGDHHKYQRAFALVKLAFALNNWSDCGGDASFSQSSAATEGLQVVGEAIAILRELGDNGHLAEAVMTKGILMPRYNTQAQTDLYEEALELSKQAYGENNTLSSRIYGNMGIAYETIGQLRKAYKYFQLAAQCTEEVFGPDHPKTLQNQAVLEEDTYVAVARQIQREAENGGVQEEDGSDDYFDSDEGIDEHSAEEDNVQEERQEVQQEDQ